MLLTGFRYVKQLIDTVDSDTRLVFSRCCCSFSSAKSLPTREGANFLKDKNAKHLTSEEFKERFDATESAKKVRSELAEPVPEEEAEPLIELSSRHYQNSSFRSMRLLAAREILLWWRDKYQIKARIVQGSCG